MSNPASLKPFKKGKDPRRNTTGQNKGSFSMTTKVREFLLEKAKDGETYGDKLKRAAILRAINKSDVMAKEIWDRVDGKVPMPITGADGAPLLIQISKEIAEKHNVPAQNTSDSSERPA